MGRALLFALVSTLAAASAQAATPCSDGSGILKVLVKGKTPIRRGPGLNYAVSAFLEEGKCMKANEVSTDGAWVLIQDSAAKTFGWVPVQQLDPESQAALGAKAPEKVQGPVGSGQSRGYVHTSKATKLYKAPKRGAGVHKPLPAGTQLLALTLTNDGRWMEVRDDRTETGWVRVGAVKATPDILAALPRTDGAALVTGLDPKAKPVLTDPPPPPAGVDPDLAPDADPDEVGAGDPAGQAVVAVPTASDSLGFEGFVAGLAALPSLTLDSNGVQAIRRYNVSALGVGASVGGQLALGPLSARIAYGFAKLGGIKPDQSPVAIDGSLHDVAVALALPLPVGKATIGPELGYSLAIASLLPALPGSTQATFLSTTTHGIDAGAAAHFPISTDLSLDARAALEVGFTSEGPISLGKAGLSLGTRVGAGVSYLLSDPLALVLRWDLRYLRTSYEGQSPADPTITTASLTRLENAFALGVAFRL